MLRRQLFPPFGALLRQARMAAGLTQAQLAERATLSVRGISDLERGINRTPRSYTIGRLAETLALSPAERARFLGAAMREAPAIYQTATPDELDPVGGDRGAKPVLRIVRQPPMLTPSPPSQCHHLPAEPTRFIGRARALRAITHLLEDNHLLTLVGPPGAGKTRLALHLAWQVAEGYRDGVYCVSLAPVGEPALVPHAIARALGIREAAGQPLVATLQQALRDKHLLLLLDNFEHLLPAATHVSDLLAAAPHLHVLATSREPLHLYGEQEYAVPPLELPDLDDVERLGGSGRLDSQTLSALSAWSECESIALFLQRARAVRPGFALTADNARDIAQICVRLDGLPLAIELAAARIRLLPPRTLLARLTQANSRLDTLSGGVHNVPVRQQTLENTIAWSYHLLSAGEQLLFARLAVFRGGCSLDAVEAVCGEGLPLDVFAGLESLVTKSLLLQQELPDGEPRFGLLQLLHAYARERLQASGEAAALRRRHAAYFVELAECAESAVRLEDAEYWTQRIEQDQENLRAVLEWALGDEGGEGGEGDIELGVRLASALCWFWSGQGHHVEGRDWTQRLLPRLEEAPPAYQPKFLVVAGHLALLDDLDVGRRLLLRARALASDLGDQLQMARALTSLGYTLLREPDAARPLVEEGLSVFRRLQYPPGIAHALDVLGEIARCRGADEDARRAYEACLAIAQQTGERGRIAITYTNLAFLAFHAGDPERAQDLARQALQLARATNYRLYQAVALATLAGALGALAQLQYAARLLGASGREMERLGAVHSPSDQPEIERIIAMVRAQLDEATFQAAWAEGRTLSLEQAVTCALEHHATCIVQE